MFSIRPPSEAFAAIKAHDSEINAICIGPLLSTGGAGQRLVTGSSDQTAKVWDLMGTTAGRGGKASSGGAKLVCDLKGSEGAVMDVAFHRMKGDGKGESDRVAGACADSKVRVWDVATERVKQTFAGHRGKVQAVKWSSDGRTLVSGGADRTIMLWDVPRSTCKRSLPASSTCTSFSMGDAGGKILASGHFDGVVRLWDLSTQQKISDVRDVHEGTVTSVTLSPDLTGRSHMLGASAGAGGCTWQVITSGKDHTLKLLDIRTYGVIKSLAHSEYRCGSNYAQACFSPDGCFAMAGGGDGSLFCWNVQGKGVELSSQDDDIEDSNVIVLGPTGGRRGACVGVCAWEWNPAEGRQVIASADKNGFIKLWQ